MLSLYNGDFIMDFRKYLTEDIIPFWLNNAIDEKNGGIYTSLERDGSIYGTDKSVWFQGRALWVFSKLYNCIEKNPAYLESAKTIYSFLDKCTDDDRRMFFLVTEDGRKLQKRRYFFSETFAAIGCAEYYKAVKDIEIYKKAEKYFDTACKVFFNNEMTTPKFCGENYGLKALSPVMIMMSTAQVMESTGINCEKYRRIARKTAHEVLKGGFLNDDVGALLENVTNCGKFCDSPTGRIVNPGHSLETAWFMMSEGILDGNDEELAAGKKIIDITMPIGLDKKHGGILSFIDISGKPPVQLEWDMKLWWPQCEAIIANRFAYSLFGENKYKAVYEEMLEYAMKNFSDFEYGEWYGYLHYDNTVSNTLKGNIFKGPFHLPRMLIILSCIEETGDIKKYLK
jgi:N-acylglucosamine 2-epimerase